jgi:hypothetical protein
LRGKETRGSSSGAGDAGVVPDFYLGRNVVEEIGYK